MSISTHILDTATGKPMAAILVDLFAGEEMICSLPTNSDGRVPALLPSDVALQMAVYRLRFHVNGEFFPEINITFRVKDANAHYHVPLLLSPFGYSTYRGS